MIFVTVGMHSQGFDRLIFSVDSLAEKFEEEFFIQIGNSKYVPRNAEYCAFLNQSDYYVLLEKAKIVITHGGAASITQALSCGKKVIIVPRLRRFSEHIDDHQLEISHFFLKKGLVKVVVDINHLAVVLRDSLTSCDNIIRYEANGSLILRIVHLVNQLHYYSRPK